MWGIAQFKAIFVLKEPAEPSKGEALETYIVRIYRQGKTIPHRLVGIVEKSGAEGKQAFTCLDELWGILNPATIRKTTGREKKETRGRIEGKAHHSKKINQKKKGESHELQKKF